jgi:choline-sulfatase
MADEHARQVIGAYGNPVIQTPNLDRLAADGTLFENAYCNDPICVPSRASFATGRYVHETGHWDNSHPYLGDPPSWGHRLVEKGHSAVSIGKLHYRNEDDPTGFSEQIIPLHVLDGVGDLTGLLRDSPRRAAAQMAASAGPGESTYLNYDRRIRDAAIEWIEDQAEDSDEKPWALFVSFVCPHFPLIAPPEFFERYPLDSVPFPFGRNGGHDHPVIEAFRHNMPYDKSFRDDDHVRKAVAAYYGMVTFQDDNVGRILAALDKGGFADNTVVVYTADHGENLGARRLWGKSNMYEESAGIPMIVRGPGVPKGKRVRTAVSLVDAFPTIVQTVGEELAAADRDIPGRSLVELANEPDDPNRTVFCEYHAAGAITGFFMVRWDRSKHVFYADHPAQLFDLEADPEESRNLAADPAYAAVLADGDRRLRAICDPVAVSREAFEAQRIQIEEFGGPEKILTRGGFAYTPAPGEVPALY